MNYFWRIYIDYTKTHPFVDRPPPLATHGREYDVVFSEGGVDWWYVLFLLFLPPFVESTNKTNKQKYTHKISQLYMKKQQQQRSRFLSPL
jgi:hypothetical protein